MISSSFTYWVSKMEHEERLKKAARWQRYAELLPTQVEFFGWRLFSVIGKLIGQWLGLRKQAATILRNTGPLNTGDPESRQPQNQPSELGALPAPLATFFQSMPANAWISEEEWQLLARMVNNKRISLEQAEQLLGVLNG